MRVVVRVLGRSVAGARGLAERATSGTSREKKRKHGGEQRSRGPPQPLPRLQQPNPTGRSHHRAIGTKLVGNASVPTRCRDEARALGTGHGRKIVDVKLAVVAETSLAVAAHRFPLFGTRRGDAERRRFRFHGA